MAEAAISFNQIPVNLLTPGQYVEFDNSKAIGGLVAMPQRLMLIAPMLAIGTGTANTPTQISREADGVALFGRGSIGAAMVSAVFKATDTLETWVLPVADAAQSVAAEALIEVAGAPTEAGVLSVYIAGERVLVGVGVNDTAAVIAENITDAINAFPDFPVTAGVTDAEVTLTARHKGSLGNDIDVRLNYYTLSEKTPAGLTITITPMSGGTGDASIATALSNIGSGQYNTILCAFADAANLALIEAELDTRWGPLYQNDGHAHIGLRGSVGSINASLAARNNPHITFWTLEVGGEPKPLWVKAATAGAISAYYLAIDPARPLQTLALPGILPAPEAKHFTRAERNNLLSYGAATTVVDSGGNVCIERAVTSYTENASGLIDPSYRDIETMYTLSYLRYSVRARISQKFPRYKLANDGTNYAPGQAIVTPKIIRAELIALFRDWEDVGLVEDVDQFKADLIVARNTTDANRVDVLLPPNIVNQFRVFAAQIQFRL
ncbi:MAG: phage tail sheath subtilisin-like domain-containing protein [Candidatus Accumulibacter sp.]|jgi:phage tail sheath gpL-like|nr:phage tail sheath subtilisin-like domain-containing protein [Accumulibacter sp.]